MSDPGPGGGRETMRPVSDYLTPDQIERLDDGWHVAIVLGPAQLDAMHAALTLDYCDQASKDVAAEVYRQIGQRHLLDRIGRMIDGETR